jgi:hypothetical protein
MALPQRALLFFPTSNKSRGMQGLFGLLFERKYSKTSRRKAHYSEEISSTFAGNNIYFNDSNHPIFAYTFIKL